MNALAAVARFTILGLVSVALMGGCNKSGTKVGDKVKAPWSRSGNMYPGKVTAVYGKLARIDFDDGDHGWAELASLEPPGTPGSAPSDTCAVAVGAKVKAPWSRTNTLYSGTASEVHGKLVHVKFDDGDHGWALCAEVKP